MGHSSALEKAETGLDEAYLCVSGKYSDALKKLFLRQGDTIIYVSYFGRYAAQWGIPLHWKKVIFLPHMADKFPAKIRIGFPHGFGRLSLDILRDFNAVCHFLRAVGGIP